MRLLACVALLAAGTMRSCLDPTTGTPPPPGAAVPAFQSRTFTVDRTDVASTWHAGCPVDPSQLRRLSISHWGFDGQAHLGELVVHRDVAASVTAVFRRLYDGRYPIHRMHRVDHYGGSDDRSMADDNTSGFNCRFRTGSTSTWSEHSYGTAIDVNPVENPYVKGSVVLPQAGRPYADRKVMVPGVIHAGDMVVQAFGAAGWSWGGAWRSPVDYQHFSRSGH